MYKTKLWDCSNLRTDSSQSLSGAGAAVEFGNNHGVADGHQEDGDEEHDDVDEEVIYLLDSMDLNHDHEWSHHWSFYNLVSMDL